MTVHSLLSPRQARGCKKAGHIHLIDMAGFNAIPRRARGCKKAGHIHLIDMAGFNAIPRRARELYGF